MVTYGHPLCHDRSPRYIEAHIHSKTTARGNKLFSCRFVKYTRQHDLRTGHTHTPNPLPKPSERFPFCSWLEMKPRNTIRARVHAHSSPPPSLHHTLIHHRSVVVSAVAPGSDCFSASVNASVSSGNAENSSSWSLSRNLCGVLGVCVCACGWVGAFVCECVCACVRPVRVRACACARARVCVGGCLCA